MSTRAPPEQLALDLAPGEGDEDEPESFHDWMLSIPTDTPITKEEATR